MDTPASAATAATVVAVNPRSKEQPVSGVEHGLACELRLLLTQARAVPASGLCLNANPFVDWYLPLFERMPGYSLVRYTWSTAR